MERLLSGVREIGEIDARLETEDAVVVDAEALLREVVDGVRRRADNGIEIVLTSAGSPLPVRASAERLTQVFENLLDNARSFSSPGGIVNVALGAQDGTVRILVEDQGSGIPETHLGKIFDRFFTYRPDEPNARNGHTGLGLAIAKAIVESYGGTITARNRPEGGARFEVRLPRVG
jgi:two-component system sensor histidine kinase ChvG